jgi:hypothetical protein
MPPKRKADVAVVDADRIDAATQNIARNVTSYDELFDIVQQVRSIALVLKAQRADDGEKALHYLLSPWTTIRDS